MHITPVVRQKRICCVGSREGIDVFLVEDTRVAIAVELKSSTRELKPGGEDWVSVADIELKGVKTSASQVHCLVPASLIV